jgi:hypothetical protein
MFPQSCSRSVVTALSCLLLATQASQAEQIKYPSGAVLDVDLGCTKKNGSKDQLIWSAAKVRTVKSGRIGLSYLHLINSNQLNFRSGVGGQNIAVSRLIADADSTLTISGQGSFSASQVSGGGNIILTGKNQSLQLGTGSLGILTANFGVVSLKQTDLQNLIVGQQTTAVGIKAVKATVEASGTLVTSGSLISTLAVIGKLELRTSAPLTVGKLSVGGGELSVKADAVSPAGAVITLINNTGTGAAAVSPAFFGVREGAIITVPRIPATPVPLKLKISYVGGTGNDVTGTVQ